MIIKHGIIVVETPARAFFEDITDRVKDKVKESYIKNGIVTVYSQHTSCSVLIQEESEDVTYWNTQLVLQDMLNIFEGIIPTCRYEGQYLHPGPVHIENAVRLRNEEKGWCLNTDAHLRSALIGRSETIPIADGYVILGEFGRVYFADFDHTRARERKVHVQIMGE